MSRSFETVVAAGMITISIYVFALSAMTEKIIYVYPALAAEEEEPVQIEIIEVPQNADVKWIDYLYREAKRFGADPEKMIATIECESAGWQASIQSYYRYTFSDPERGIVAGEQELSFGLAQIHLPDWEVTEGEAKDPYFAIQFMAEKFGQDDAHYWSCYKKLFGKQSSTI